MDGEVWRQDYKMQTLVYPRKQNMDGEATECRLCKQCGCLLNTDYISQVEIDPHADQEQEINFVRPSLRGDASSEIIFHTCGHVRLYYSRDYLRTAFISLMVSIVRLPFEAGVYIRTLLHAW